MADITTIILTYNEELNIEKCINSVRKVSHRIVVVDSFSNDNTVVIAKKMGAEVIQNKFINHAKQFNYGLQEAHIKTQWVFRIDADERLTPESSDEIENLCNIHKDSDVNGIIVRFEVNFLGKKLKHGGIYPFRKLLLFKFGYGEIEDRNMDEHIYLTEGKSVELKNDSLHYDYKDLTFWIDKHNKYSSKEFQDYIESLTKTDNGEQLNRNARIKRLIKYKVYYKLPMSIRAFSYFVYRYIFKNGFLDGKEGLIFAVLQAFWYRFLVDAKIYEYEKLYRNKR